MSNVCINKNDAEVGMLKKWLKYSSAFISVKDITGKYVAMSNAYANFLGYKHCEEVLGKYAADIFPLKYAAACQKQDKLVINTARTLTFKNKFLHPKKGLLYLEGVKTPILDETKSVIAVETVVTDVTEKYELFHKIQREQTKFKKFFNDIPIAVWIKDSKSRFVNVNKEFCEIFKVKKEEVIGSKYVIHERLVGIIGEEELSLMQAQDTFVLKENKRHVLEFCRVQDGKKSCIKMIKIPICRQGKVLGLIGCCHSTEDRKPL